MAYYENYRTGNTDELISNLNALIERAYDSGGDITEGFFLLHAAKLTNQNLCVDGKKTLSLDNIEGGPFSAILVQYEGGLDDQGRGVGKPRIIGAGTNHVVPEHDPSAHGEISAIRDASARLEQSDLSGAVMFSSCECCPQCQAAATAVGIESIIFANDRHQAAAIGFSDAQQYELANDMTASMTFLDDSALVDKRDGYLSALADHGAVIVNDAGEILGVGDANLSANDPLESLASLNAIRHACKNIGNFHLPEDATLITRDVIHPVAFTTADWARIGRIRDATDPGNPSADQPVKDPFRMIHITEQREELFVHTKEGGATILHSASSIAQDVTAKPEDRKLTLTRHAENSYLLKRAHEAFDRWKLLTSQNETLRY